MSNSKLSQNWVDLEKPRQKNRTRLDDSSMPVGRKTLKKSSLRREMAFSYTSSSVSAKAKNAKKAKKCIFLVDPVWCTVNARIFLFLVDKNVNIPSFSANYNRTT